MFLRRCFGSGRFRRLAFQRNGAAAVFFGVGSPFPRTVGSRRPSGMRMRNLRRTLRRRTSESIIIKSKSESRRVSFRLFLRKINLKLHTMIKPILTLKSSPLRLMALPLLAVLAACGPSDDRNRQPSAEDFESLSAQFAEPSREYGSAPLFVWNKIVTPERIDEAMTDLKAKGFGSGAGQNRNHACIQSGWRTLKARKRILRAETNAFRFGARSNCRRPEGRGGTVLLRRCVRLRARSGAPRSRGASGTA